MFRVRDRLASDDEAARQKTVWSVVRGEPAVSSDAASTADGRLKMLAAAVYGHRQIEPIVRLKIYKTLDSVLRLLRSAGDDIGPEIKTRVGDLLERTPVEFGDVVRLPVRPPILAYTPEPPSTYDFKLPTRRSTGVTLFDFEQMAFDNHLIYQYYEGVTFATYFYQNAVYALGATDVDSHRRWQARLASLIKRTGFSDSVATGAFYEDTVRYRGVDYDTSFVPDFDVRSLVPRATRVGCEISPTPHCTGSACVALQRRQSSASPEEALAYRAALDVRRVDRVPPHLVTVFLTFPFKDGHYVRPDGTVTFLDVSPPRRASLRATVERVCETASLEEDVYDAARTLRLSDVLAYALYANRLESQAVSLLILRQMIGNWIRVNGMRIRLPYRNEVLRWVSFRCARKAASAEDVRVLLPNGGGKGGGRNRNSVATVVALVRDIADSAQSKLAVAFLCSSFHIMEVDYLDAHDALDTHAELYVFFTLVLQQYGINAYRVYRDRLRPEFAARVDDTYDVQDTLAFLAGKYRKFSRPYAGLTVQDRIDSFTEPLISPTEVSSLNASKCDPDTCMETYEFVDGQLSTLATTGDVDLTPYQTASYLALLVS